MRLPMKTCGHVQMPRQRTKEKQASNHRYDAWMPVLGKEVVTGKQAAPAQTRSISNDAPFTDTGSFAAALTQIVQAGTTNPAQGDHFDFFDSR
jgi:hypothetical protein